MKEVNMHWISIQPLDTNGGVMEYLHLVLCVRLLICPFLVTIMLKTIVQSPLSVKIIMEIHTIAIQFVLILVMAKSIIVQMNLLQINAIPNRQNHQNVFLLPQLFVNHIVKNVLTQIRISSILAMKHVQLANVLTQQTRHINVPHRLQQFVKHIARINVKEMLQEQHVRITITPFVNVHLPLINVQVILKKRPVKIMIRLNANVMILNAKVKLIILVNMDIILKIADAELYVKVNLLALVHTDIILTLALVNQLLQLLLLQSQKYMEGILKYAQQHLHLAYYALHH